MRHQYKGRKLGSSWSHTKAMRRSLTCALFENDRIKTTETRAKEIRRDADKIITLAKRGDLHSRRLAISALGNKELVREVFEKVEQGMFKDRPGGYTRIYKLGSRKGDGAPMVIMELVTENCVPKSEKKKAKATSKKATPKKATKKQVESAEDKVKAEEEKNEADKENVIEEIRDNIEAEEELGAELIREAGEEQLAEEAASAAEDKAEKTEQRKEEKAAEKAKEEKMEAESEAALEAEGKGPNIQEMPESVEKA